MPAECAFCGHDIPEHDPVYLEKQCAGERVPAGQFCNYACLTHYIEREGLENGACCRLEFA